MGKQTIKSGEKYGKLDVLKDLGIKRVGAQGNLGKYGCYHMYLVRCNKCGRELESMVNEIIKDNQTSYWIEVSPVTNTVPELMCSKCGHRISFYGLYPRTCVICGSNMSNGITIHNTNYIETPGVHYYQT